MQGQRVLFLVSLAFASLILGSAYGDEVEATDGTTLSLAERQYRKAKELRSRKDPTLKQLRLAGSLLKAAAGVTITARGSEPAHNVLLPNLTTTEIYPGIHVANETHLDALKLLATIYSQEGQGLPYNPRAAFELRRLAAGKGDPEAQQEMGLALAAGIGSPREGTKDKLLFEMGDRAAQEALLHLYFAAAGNDSVAQMALGYRHMHGIGVQKSCQSAVLYYQAVAERVTNMARSPYKFPKVEKVLLSAHNKRATAPSREQEMLHYQWFADLGYVDAQRAMGRLLSQGGAETAEKALHYFRQAAEAGDSDAMARLGHVYANGIGVKANNETALEWFTLGAKGSDGRSASAKFGLGYMYLRGFGVPQDYRTAVKFLTSAAEEGHPEAWFHLGTMHLNGWGVPVSTQQGQRFLRAAADAGHIMGQYNLAMIYLRKKGLQQCELALEQLKVVAERGPWAIMLQDASDAFYAGRYDAALMGYLRASEVGYRLAQANAAWMLSNDYGLPPDQSAIGPVQPGEQPTPPAAAAIRAHQRAAQQGSVNSLLALGDCYYYGRGVARDWPQAFQLYSAAARFKDPQAYFNLAFMHEYGAGVPADPALAKRNYDKAMEFLPGAAAPVQAALLSLWLHSWWNRLRPYLPHQLDALWDRIYVLREPATRQRPIGSYLPKASLDFGALDRFFEAKFWDPEGVWIEDAQLWETCMLIALIGCLWMVVWRRATLRSARRRQAAVQAASPAHGPAGGPPPGAASTAPAPAAETARQTEQQPGAHNQQAGQSGSPPSEQLQNNEAGAGDRQ